MGRLILLVCLAALCTAARADMAGEAVDRYQQALRASSETERAAALDDTERAFAAHLRAGYDNPSTHFNLGVVALRQGKAGRAIAAFARAQAKAPRSERIATALAFARLRVGDGPPDSGVPAFLSTLMAWHTGLATDETAWAFLLCWLAGCGVAAAGRYGRNGRLWRLGLGVLAAALCLGGSLAAKTVFPQATAVIAVREADVCSGAGDHFPVTYRLSDGTEGAVLQTVPGWRLIRIEKNGSGWVREKDIEVF